MLFEEKKIDSKVLTQGRFLTLLCDNVLLPDGGVSTREYIVHPGAVMIIPLLPNGDIVLERQFRYPVKELLIEFPAGKIDVNESGLNCAQRELLEETGYKASKWAFAGQIYPCVGYSNEVIEIWFADDLRAGSTQLDDGEFVETFIAHKDQLELWSLDGTIKDAKTLVGLNWLNAYHRQLLNLDWVTPNDCDK